MPLRFASLIAWVVMIAVAPAHADEASNREEARRAFEAGQAADKQHDWRSAIAHYERANKLVPHPNTVFNIATNYERLGQLRDAAIWYGKYLNEAPLDSTDRPKVVKALRDLEIRPGTLTVRSVPDGARVLVDGKFAGVTPYSGHIKGGSHTVELDLDGLRVKRTVKIEFGEPASLDVPLRGGAADGRGGAADGRVAPSVPSGPSGIVRIDGPPGAFVLIDNTPAGQLPLTVPLAPGVHQIQVAQDGWNVYDTTVRVEADREVTVTARMTRAPGFGNPTATTPIKVGYLFGLAGGADVRGEGGLFLLELGIRASTLDASVRIGKTAGLTAVDIMARWTLTRKAFAPFISAGYTFLSDSDSNADSKGGGYMLTGGLRWDFARGERYGMSLIAESGIRYFAGLNSSSMSRSGLIVPLMTSLQIYYK